MFTCSLQEKIIVEFITWPRSKVFTPLILNTVLLSEWSSAVFISSVIDVHESLVCPEQFNCLLFFRKTLQLTNNLVFQHFCVFEPFPTMTVWFWDASFHTEDDWGTHYNYYRRLKHSPMLQKKKTCIKSQAWKLLNRMKMCIFFLFYLNIFFFFI